MKHKLLTALLLLLATGANAQNFRISGTITCDGEPINDACITEVDKTRRVLNQSLTDESGNFTMKVTGGKTYLWVSAKGMRRFIHQIGTHNRWNVSMTRRSKNPLQDLLDGKSRTIESTHLIVGHVNGSKTVCQTTWLQELNDTLYTLCIPIRVLQGNEAYPEGRKMTILDSNNNILVQASNAITVLPEECMLGTTDPNERPVDRGPLDSDYGMSESLKIDYYCYPRFKISLSDLEKLIANAKSITHINVDTALGDQYWYYYPNDKFGNELQKMLDKILK